jgi:hypothetical protein
MNEEMIAPCGMNCGVCVSYLAMKNDLKKKGVRQDVLRWLSAAWQELYFHKRAMRPAWERTGAVLL